MALIDWRGGRIRVRSRTRTHAKYLYSLIVIPLFFPYGIIAKDYVDKFDRCNENLQSVLNGNGTFLDMDRAAIRERGYIYEHWPKELPRDTGYPRERYITLTYPGLFSMSSHRSRLQETRMRCTMWSRQ
jgi:hypothetical protein